MKSISRPQGTRHAAWWGNYFKLDNQLTADLHLGSTNLRLATTAQSSRRKSIMW
ncbi:hypothetical protein [Duncaniella dubosii]|uniref:hypothetical protein n=1 Tax=Duncaniella dubosii TaxID=2518971 RepID=UPI003F66F447